MQPLNPQTLLQSYMKPKLPLGRDIRFHFLSRSGHMYAYNLVVGRMKLDESEGVVRISMLHYNTQEEVDRLIAALGSILN